MRANICVLLALTVVIFALASEGNGNPYKRVCYYTNWSQYRPGIGKYVPEDIDPTLCTHIIYAFAKVENSVIRTIEWNDNEMIQRIQNLKQKSPGLKTLIAVGGWNAGSAEFSKMVATQMSRRSFITSVIKFLLQHGFDGLDLDWEYPAQRGGHPADKPNFSLLIKELKQAFMRRKYLLTAAVPAGKNNIDQGYDVPLLGRYMDFINLMAYDLHGSWEKTTGENSPLYPTSSERGTSRQLNMNWAAEYWAKKGIPKHKLIIGMATYGRSFTLANPANNAIGAAATGSGAAGRYTREPGFLSYYEICQMIDSGRGTVKRSYQQKVPYYFNGRLWVGYDDVDSITTKVRWLMKKGYGGAMIWALDLDDFSQRCSSSTRKYPLLGTINDLLGKGTLPPTPRPNPTLPPKPTTTPVATTTKPTTHNTDHKEFTCIGKPDGFYADPKSCRSFYRCISQRAYHYTCPSKLLYNPKTKVCDWPDNVKCKVLW